MQFRVLALQCDLTRFMRLLLEAELAYIVPAPVRQVDVSMPTARVVIYANASRTGLALQAHRAMLAGFLGCDDAQVLPAAVEVVVVQE
jgi:hypothetical protein